jgi:hypothetical protein
MDLDHARGDKKFTVSTSYMHVKDKVLAEEIAKCDAVCSNCHRLRTAARIKDGTAKRKGGRPFRFLADVHGDLSEVQPGPRSLWTKYRQL